MRPLVVQLKPWERHRLRELRDHGPSPRVVKRALCLLQSALGEPARRIGAILGLSVDAVSDIRRRWRHGRLRSLSDRPRCGRPGAISPAYRRQLRRALRHGPRFYGYVFTVWSAARLAAHLRQRTGTRVSPLWLRHVIRQEGFTLGRPKHTLKGKRDEAAYQRTRRLLERLKKGR
jgi:transposase